MILSEGTKLYGFVVRRVREAAELNAKFFEMVHEKTGAELVFLDNKAKNKLFSAAFQTLPENSTGVFHILEHSVLCGSEQYPVKEPFVDLLKGSMNTFLNAMTYPDKTVYPVSSCNDKDFLNLISVYLDAIFAPNLLWNPNIFYQEGIHTEVDEDGPFYKGVVFNEMKGEMANVDARMEARMDELLFPDNCYRFNSGGDPAVIPDLTYEQYKDTYKRFYHPSNARFFLDGDIPLEETLQKISSYLDRYEKSASVSDIPMQVPVAVSGTGYYEITEDEAEKNRAIVAWGKIIGTWKDREMLAAAQILCDVLADSNEAPLKRAVLSSGLAEDFEMAVMDGVQQPYLMMTARNMKEDAKSLWTVIHDTVQSLVSGGLDSDSVTASINRFAFHAKQVSEPQGLYRALNAYQSWLYGGDPLLYLLYDETIVNLRRKAKQGYFEELLERLLADETELTVLHMLPSVTLGEEESEREDDRIRREYSLLSDLEKEKLIRKNEALCEWQSQPDSPEAAAKLPALSLDDVSKQPQWTETIERVENGVTILYHPVASHGITYLSMYFPLTNFSLEELTKLSLFPELFGELPTENYTVVQLQQKVKMHIGSLGFTIGVFGRAEQQEECTPCLEVHAGVLTENLSQARELIVEILTKTKFEYPEQIKEIVMQSEEGARQAAIGNGHSFGISAVLAHYSARHAVGEAIGGYSFLKYLHEFSENFDENIGEFLALIQRVIQESVGRAGLTVSITSSEEIPVEDLLAALPEGSARPKTALYRTLLPERLGLRIPAQISFAVKGYHLSCCGEQTEGSLHVITNMLSLSYLWNEIRVKGGAYGTGFVVRREGSMFCYSYRDPSPARSLQIYNGMADFLKVYYNSGEEIDKFIISATAAMDSLKTPREEGRAADEWWFSGITKEKSVQMRRQMLQMNRESLLRWQEPLKAMAENGAVCVVGNEEALKNCESLMIYDL